MSGIISSCSMLVWCCALALRCMVVWSRWWCGQVPEPVPPSLHGFKYRLVFARAGERVVGYDNERGKGDHKHIGALERPYPFSDVATLMNDFLADVEAFR